jgi:hypothetical protein
MLQFWFQPKQIVAILGLERINLFQPKKFVAYEGQD